MALFKSEEEKAKKQEEKLREEEEKLREEENRILEKKKFRGKVGHIHKGLSAFGLWGTLSDGKAKFKTTNFLLYDDKLFIKISKVVVAFSDIKEIFYEDAYEAVIMLYSGDGIPIKGLSSTANGRRELKAFVNVLNKMINDYKSDNANQSNENNGVKSDDEMNHLIKLGEMYEKGLLTDEEFAAMKQKLINSSNENTKDKCQNCGAELSTDSNFCSECGTKIE